MPSLVTVACVLPGQAKDLSAPPHTRKTKTERAKREGLGLTRRYKVHLYLLKEHSKFPPYIPRLNSQLVSLRLVNTTLFIALTAALVTDSSLALMLTCI